MVKSMLKLCVTFRVSDLVKWYGRNVNDLGTGHGCHVLFSCFMLVCGSVYRGPDGVTNKVATCLNVVLKL